MSILNILSTKYGYWISKVKMLHFSSHALLRPSITALYDTRNNNLLHLLVSVSYSLSHIYSFTDLSPSLLPFSYNTNTLSPLTLAGWNSVFLFFKRGLLRRCRSASGIPTSRSCIRASIFYDLILLLWISDLIMFKCYFGYAVASTAVFNCPFLFIVSLLLLSWTQWGRSDDTTDTDRMKDDHWYVLKQQINPKTINSFK